MCLKKTTIQSVFHTHAILKINILACHSVYFDNSKTALTKSIYFNHIIRMLLNSFQQLNGTRAIHAKCNKLLYLTEFVITIFRTPQFVNQNKFKNFFLRL